MNEQRRNLRELMGKCELVSIFGGRLTDNRKNDCYSPRNCAKCGWNCEVSKKRRLESATE